MPALSADLGSLFIFEVVVVIVAARWLNEIAYFADAQVDHSALGAAFALEAGQQTFWGAS